MFRQFAFSRQLFPIRGAPPCIKNRQPTRVVIHQSQKPAYSWNIDFTTLGLQYPPVYQATKISRYGYAPKPETSPEYPFFVRLMIEFFFFLIFFLRLFFRLRELLWVVQFLFTLILFVVVQKL